nr:ABC transporter substrate-binding protein [Novosphingobium sp. FSW06-99]
MITRAATALAVLLIAAAPLSARAQGPRIVSLNPCSDAILVEVADPAQIVALSAYSRDPASSSLPPGVAARYATTHGTLEEVLSLHPDVVVDGAFAAPAMVGAYHRLGLRLELLGTQRNVADALADVRHLAAIAGHPDRGEALVRRIDAALTAAAPPPRRAPVEAVFWEWGGIVAGSDTLIGDLLMRTGFANLPARQGYHQAAIYPIERLLAHPPRVLLTVGDDRMLHHPALAAVKGMARADFPAGLLYCGGPTIMRAAAYLAALHRALG